MPRRRADGARSACNVDPNGRRSSTCGPSRRPAPHRFEEVVPVSREDTGADDSNDKLHEHVAMLEAEIVNLRQRLQEVPKRVRTLEERLLETKGQLAQAVSQNEKLTYTLREAREHISALREEVDKLTQPPNAYGTVLSINDDETVDVFASGRKMRVSVHPDLDSDLKRGQEVVLNESLNVVMARGFDSMGEVVTIKEVLEDGHRALVVGRADEERVCELADDLMTSRLRSGDTVLM